MLFPTIIGGIVEVNTPLNSHTSMAIFLPLQLFWIPFPFILYRKKSKTIDDFLKCIEFFIDEEHSHR